VIPAGVRVYLNEKDETALFERSGAPLNETIWEHAYLWIDKH
jgi:hypothetical protein